MFGRKKFYGTIVDITTNTNGMFSTSVKRNGDSLSMAFGRTTIEVELSDGTHKKFYCSPLRVKKFSKYMKGEIVANNHEIFKIKLQ